MDAGHVSHCVPVLFPVVMMDRRIILCFLICMSSSYFEKGCWCALLCPHIWASLSWNLIIFAPHADWIFRWTSQWSKPMCQKQGTSVQHGSIGLDMISSILYANNYCLVLAPTSFTLTVSMLIWSNRRWISFLGCVSFQGCMDGYLSFDPRAQVVLQV